MKKVLLISGGVDSLTIFAEKKDVIDEYVYFYYGQKFIEKELSVLDTLGIQLKRITLPDMKCNEKGFFYGRNMHFFIRVREEFVDEDILVYFGNNADDNFQDNSREYLLKLEQLLNNGYPHKTIRIVCPYENLSKQEIIKRNIDAYGVMVGCGDSGNDEPCRTCHSCVAMISAGKL